MENSSNVSSVINFVQISVLSCLPSAIQSHFLQSSKDSAVSNSYSYIFGAFSELVYVSCLPVFFCPCLLMHILIPQFVFLCHSQHSASPPKNRCSSEANREPGSRVRHFLCHRKVTTKNTLKLLADKDMQMFDGSR